MRRRRACEAPQERPPRSAEDRDGAPEQLLRGAVVVLGSSPAYEPVTLAGVASSGMLGVSIRVGIEVLSSTTTR